MAILNAVGFDVGDATELALTAGTFSIQSSVVRSGGYAFRTNPTTTGTGSGYLGILSSLTGQNTILNAADGYLTVYVRIATAPASDSEPIITCLDNSANPKLEVRIDSARNLSIWDGTTQKGSTGSTVLALDTWYKISFAVYDLTTVSWELEIDDASELSGSDSLTFGANFTGYFALGKFVNRNGNSVDYYFDDAIFSDTSFLAGTYYADILTPTGAGNYTAWTGDYTAVDDLPHDGDTSYINSTTATQVETVTVETLAAAGLSVDTVVALKSYTICREPSGGSSQVQTRLRSATTDDDTGSRNYTGTYSHIGKVYETDPATSSAWLTSAVDAVEVGVEQNHTVDVRCTAMCVIIVYTPAGGGGGAASRLTQSILFKPNIIGGALIR